MGKKKKKIEIVIENTGKFRKKVPPPGFTFKNKKAYTRKLKHKKGWSKSSHPFFFLKLNTGECCA